MRSWALAASSAALAVASVPVHRETSHLSWARTQCGPGDIVTQWGATVDPSQPILPEYPRPQMSRDARTWANLNGLWEFQPGTGASEPPPFGQTLSGSILVPFPVESCLSGVGETHMYLWYRTLVNSPFAAATGNGRLLLHFGAVDWNTTVYVNQVLVCSNVGGFNGFECDVTAAMQASDNEIIVGVYDPSDSGAQPNGKQRISAIANPGGDTYTPSSGIWQTVWLESVPSTHITGLRILANMTGVSINVSTSSAVSVSAAIYDPQGAFVTNLTGMAGTPLSALISTPQLWHPDHPFLYTFVAQVCVAAGCDVVSSYFGMREVALGFFNTTGKPMTGPQVGVDRSGQDMPGYPVLLPQADYNLCWAMCNQTAGCTAWAYGVPNCYHDPASAQCWLKNGHPNVQRNESCRVSGDQGDPGGLARQPQLNGNFTFLAGWLDQSWWPDGQYTAPTDAALMSDLAAVKTFGLNTVRLHQKVNPERWYYFADTLGVVLLHDAPQKYGGASAATIPFFMHDIQAMIDGRYNHPSIIQWDVFNEEDCVGVFNATQVVEWVQAYDPSRLVDTNSGGPANNLHIADVNDIHDYPYPQHAIPSATQYAMVGEFGGIGAFVSGHEWVPAKCQTYLPVATPQDEADTYVNMTRTIASFNGDVSISIYTQISDVERECDGFLNYDRTNKFTPAQLAEVVAANQALIHNVRTA